MLVIIWIWINVTIIYKPRYCTFISSRTIMNEFIFICCFWYQFRISIFNNRLITNNEHYFFIISIFINIKTNIYYKFSKKNALVQVGSFFIYQPVIVFSISLISELHPTNAITGKIKSNFFIFSPITLLAFFS